MVPTALLARPPLLMAALGAISGALSAAISLEGEPVWLAGPGKLFFLQAGLVPAGVAFAAAVGVGLWMVSARALPALLAALVTLYAWSAAVHTATRIVATSNADGRLILASLAAGALGAAITQLGGSLAWAGLRRPRRVTLTTAVGAVVGLLCYAGERNIVDFRLLFLIWQPAVAWAIGWGVRGRTGSD
jgi:hypothetical protein